jgi:hypothetical protein
MPEKTNQINIFFKLGQFIGIASGSFAAILWMMSLWAPDTSFTFNIASTAVVLLMIVLSIIIIVATLKAHATAMIIIFGISFFPIGLYVLGVPHWIQWVGLANIGYLMAGVLIWRFKPIDYKDSFTASDQE